MPKVKISKIERIKDKLRKAWYADDVATECLDEIRHHGLVVSGSIGCGKSTMAKWLNAIYIINSERSMIPSKVRVFDIVGNWQNWFISGNKRFLTEYTTETNIEDNDKTLLFHLDITSNLTHEVISSTLNLMTSCVRLLVISKNVNN